MSPTILEDFRVIGHNPPNRDEFQFILVSMRISLSNVFLGVSYSIWSAI
jgi:hypothetical protein